MLLSEVRKKIRRFTATHRRYDPFRGEDNTKLRKMVDKRSSEKQNLKELGECLVMGPGRRHKAIGYLERNLGILFLTLLGGWSICASFFETYRVLTPLWARNALKLLRAKRGRQTGTLTGDELFGWSGLGWKHLLCLFTSTAFSTVQR